MSSETLFELAPLAALGSLDGAERSAFDVASGGDPALRRELLALEQLVGQIGLGSEPVAPAPAVRARVMAAAAAAPRTAPAEGRPSPSRGPHLLPWLSLAAAAVLALGAFTWRSERDAARREAARAQAEAATLTAQNLDLRARLEVTQRRLDVAEAFRSLVAQPTTRVAMLAGLPAAPAARGRVVWNADWREAVLLTAGLPTAPAGKAYEAWVIAAGAPVAAGLFRTDAAGAAVHTLPRLEDVAHAKTFAVTLEPEAGTEVPTGPMVLAGPAL